MSGDNLLAVIRQWRNGSRRVFEEFAPFTRRVLDLLDDEDLARVQALLLVRPDAGQVFPGRAGCGNCVWLPKVTESEARRGDSERGLVSRGRA
jgi:hypothetical protein